MGKGGRCPETQAGGTRDAERRNRAGDHPRPRQIARVLDDTGKPGTPKGVRPVWGGADGKVPISVTRQPPTLLCDLLPISLGCAPRRGRPTMPIGKVRPHPRADQDQAGRVWSVRTATRRQTRQEPPGNLLLSGPDAVLHAKPKRQLQGWDAHRENSLAAQPYVAAGADAANAQTAASTMAQALMVACRPPPETNVSQPAATRPQPEPAAAADAGRRRLRPMGEEARRDGGGVCGLARGG